MNLRYLPDATYLAECLPTLATWLLNEDAIVTPMNCQTCLFWDGKGYCELVGNGGVSPEEPICTEGHWQRKARMELSDLLEAYLSESGAINTPTISPNLFGVEEQARLRTALQHLREKE